MVTVETIGRVRRLLSQKVSIRAIARQCCVSRNTVRKIRDSGVVIPQYKKRDPRPGKLTPFEKILCNKLEEDLNLKARQRRKAVLLYEELQRERYAGSYDIIAYRIESSHDKKTGWRQRSSSSSGSWFHGCIRGNDDELR